MSVNKFWLGSVGPLLYDDTEDLPSNPGVKQSPLTLLGASSKFAIFDVNGRLAAGSSGEGDYIPASLIDAKGDLIAGTGDDSLGRVPVGANGTVLIADNSLGVGMKWGRYVSPKLTSNLAADLALPATTWTTIVSLNITEGTWEIWGVATLGKAAASITGYGARLRNTSDGIHLVEGAGITPSAANASVTITIRGEITVAPSGTKVVALQGYATIAATAYATIPTIGLGLATTLYAKQIG